jgi:hypothetical protein
LNTALGGTLFKKQTRMNEESRVRLSHYSTIAKKQAENCDRKSILIRE